MKTFPETQNARGATSIFRRTRPICGLAQYRQIPLISRLAKWSQQMTTPSQYRAHADKYSELIKGTDKPDEIREFKRLEHTFKELAENEDWMVNNSSKTVHIEEATNTVPLAEGEPTRALTEEEGRILRCLGASVIMQWNTFPRKLQRELFDNASSVGELLETGAFKQQLARFLHKHKDDEGGMKIQGN